MRIIECDQRTPEWFEARSGIVSASEIGAWVAKPTWTPAMEGYADKLISKKLHQVAKCESPPEYQDWSMKRGNQLEPEAREAYEALTGRTVEQVGFVIHPTMLIGCSPDGLTDDRKRNVEIKCPLGSTHFFNQMRNELPPGNKMQCHMQMAVCGTSVLDFFCYLPNQAEFLFEVERDFFTELVLAGLTRLNERYLQRRGEERERWEKWKGRINEEKHAKGSK